MQNLTSLTQNSSGNITLKSGKTLTFDGSGSLTIGSVDSGSSSQLYVKGKGKIHLHEITLVCMTD